MVGASIETTLELWASLLRDLKARIGGLFPQERVAASANRFLNGLLGNERRKTGWMRAEAAGDSSPCKQQAILGRSRWEADELRDIVRGYVVAHLAADDAVIVIDETGFPKQEDILRSIASVYRLSGQDNELPDRCVRRLCFSARACLYRSSPLLAQELDSDLARLAAAHVPEAVTFATKPALVVDMIGRPLGADMQFRLLAFAALALSSSTPVPAADVVYEQSVPPSVKHAYTAYDWSGCYLGAQGGYNWDQTTVLGSDVDLDVARSVPMQVTISNMETLFSVSKTTSTTILRMAVTQLSSGTHRAAVEPATLGIEPCSSRLQVSLQQAQR